MTNKPIHNIMNYATRVITTLFLVALTACSSTKQVTNEHIQIEKKKKNVIDNPKKKKKTMRN